MAELRMEHAGGALIPGLSGTWGLDSLLPSSAVIESDIETKHSPGRITFDTGRLGGRDSAIFTFLVDVTGIRLRKCIIVEEEEMGYSSGSSSRLAGA